MTATASTAWLGAAVTRALRRQSDIQVTRKQQRYLDELIEQSTAPFTPPQDRQRPVETTIASAGGRVEHASALSAWESFYVIVGSSAAALTGLQFVVIALLADMRRKSSEKEISAFATPTVVHFVSALLVSAALSAPWPSAHGAAIAVGGIGGVGLVYAIIVIVRALRQRKYVMVFEDYLWHTALPLAAYGSLTFGAFALWQTELVPLFVIGGASLLLMSIGIHNAWDTVTFLLLDELKAGTGESSIVEPPPLGDTSEVAGTDPVA